MKSMSFKERMAQMHEEFLVTDDRISRAQARARQTVESFPMPSLSTKGKSGRHVPKRQLKVHGNRTNLK